MDIERYLQRLGLEREPPSLEYLSKLQLHHLRNIPFENLDVHYGKPIILDLKQIEKKIIPTKRGGSDFELNGLFYNLLLNLGYSCYLGGASFYIDDGKFTQQNEHMVIIVEISYQKYLVDVGLHNNFTVPKKMIPNQVFLDHTTYYKWEVDPDDHFLLRKSSNGTTFSTLFRLTQDQFQFIQFLDVNTRLQEDPESSLRREKYISILSENNIRYILTDTRFQIIHGSQTQSIDITSNEEFYSKLEEFFQLKMEDVLSQH